MPGDDRAAAGIDVLVRIGAGWIAGEANLIAGGVAGVVVVQAADDRPLVHDPGRTSAACRSAWMPGTLVGLTPNSPRNSAGASGLGSHMSMWLGPPRIQRMMTEGRSRGRRRSPPALACGAGPLTPGRYNRAYRPRESCADSGSVPGEFRHPTLSVFPGISPSELPARFTCGERASRLTEFVLHSLQRSSNHRLQRL